MNEEDGFVILKPERTKTGKAWCDSCGWCEDEWMACIGSNDDPGGSGSFVCVSCAKRIVEALTNPMEEKK